MSCVHFGGVILNVGGPTVILKVNNRHHTFEMHSYMGPVRLLADGYTPAKHFWAEKSDFWPVFEKWRKQGERVDKDGYGIVGEEGIG